MITYVSVTFTGIIKASSDFDIANVSTTTPITVAVAGGAIGAGHQLEIGAGTTLSAHPGGGLIVGPSSGTIGIQDFGAIVLNSGSVTANLMDVSGVLNVQSGGVTVGTLGIGAALGASVASLRPLPVPAASATRRAPSG